VLVLLHENDATSILFSAGGVTYAIQRLKSSNSAVPTADDRTLANLVLNSLKPNDIATATTMTDLAMKWNDIERWKAVIKKSGLPISTFGVDKLLQAWKMFSFEGVHARYVVYISHSSCAL
jgi:hypothetical protein